MFFFLGSIDVNSNLINLQSVQTKSFPCAFTAQLFIDFANKFVFVHTEYSSRFEYTGPRVITNIIKVYLCV